MAEQSFIHCENSNDHLTLHDCVAEKAYLKDGALIFEFKDGFWISPQHPENSHGKMLRTDNAKVEFVLAKGRGFLKSGSGSRTKGDKLKH